MGKRLRRAVVRAAPTCTLWRHCVYEDVYRFVFRSAWVITGVEIAQNG